MSNTNSTNTPDVSLGDIYGVTKRTVFKAVTVVDQTVDVVAMASEVAHVSMTEARDANAVWAARSRAKRQAALDADLAELGLTSVPKPAKKAS